ncbi:hypothetical protein O9992_21340 [Vibrio lentus]|nr:hypothetical protein [Vibrio lentus]
MDLSQVSTFEVCWHPNLVDLAESDGRGAYWFSRNVEFSQRITAIGGSDSHLEPHERNPKNRMSLPFMATTAFAYSHGLSGEGIGSTATKCAYRRATLRLEV